MHIQAVLFDLDGTLLPMGQDVFVNTYFGLLAKKLAPMGYEPKKLISTVWGGTKAMVENDGSMTNKDAFWNFFKGVYGDRGMQDMPHFDAFYANEFNMAQSSCGYTPKAAQIIKQIKESGRRVVLATNPLFPTVATQARIRWAGLNFADFDLVTTYENSRWCKPDLGYYREILDKIGLQAEECAMVGNDTSDDLPADKLGMQVFLLTDCLINASGVDVNAWPHGGFDELSAWAKELP